MVSQYICSGIWAFFFFVLFFFLILASYSSLLVSLTQLPFIRHSLLLSYGSRRNILWWEVGILDQCVSCISILELKDKSEDHCACSSQAGTKSHKLSVPMNCEDLGHYSHRGGQTCAQRTQGPGQVQHSSPALALGHTLGFQRKLEANRSNVGNKASPKGRGSREKACSLQ